MKGDQGTLQIDLSVPEPREKSGWLQSLWSQVRASLRQRDTQFLLGIIAIAALLRLSYLDLIEFKADEAQHLLRSARLVEEGEWPLVGTMASVGVAKPPLMVYLMAVPLLLGRDPRIASAFIALLNIAAIAGLFLLVRRYYGLRVAAISTLLLAVNPWAVAYSRKAFTADLLLPFAVLFLWGLLRALVDRRPWGWVLACLSLGLSLYLTFSPLPIFIVFVLLVVFYRSRVSWAHLAFGICLAFCYLYPIYITGTLTGWMPLAMRFGACVAHPTGRPPGHGRCPLPSSMRLGYIPDTSMHLWPGPRSGSSLPYALSLRPSMVSRSSFSWLHWHLRSCWPYAAGATGANRMTRPNTSFSHCGYGCRSYSGPYFVQGFSLTT